MSLFSIYPWWTWLLGTLGIGGIVLLIVCLPAAAGIAEKGFVAILSRVWSTRLGMALICILVALWIGHTEGALFMRGQCNEQQALDKLAAEQAAHEITRRDLATAQQAATFNNTAFGWITSTDGTRQEIIREQQSKPAAADCHKLGGAGVKFLQRIAPD